MSTFRVGKLQASGLEIYVFDPIFDDCPAFDGDYDAFPGTFGDGILSVDDGKEEAAWRRLVDACNSADDDGDREICNALSNLSTRVLKAAP